ncbi:MAG: biotin--[acetyl-CoA-carboxylase] ligase [Mariprofundaceae bacterium]|nr:biotin--[acetyl-CoA-carboxylase] ligase [Mariprofundaceae bacterium]
MNLASFQAQLKTKHLGQPCLFLDEVGSSNDEAFTQYENTHQLGLVVFARQQTKARGRLGRRWHTEVDKALAVSIVLSPPIELKYWSQLTLLAGLALQQTLVSFAPDAKLKWPNDILIHGSKVAGILTESRMCADQHVMVIGIGINLIEPSQGWPKDIQQAVTDLKTHAVQAVDQQALSVMLLQKLDHWYDQYLQHGFAAIQQPWWEAHYASYQKVRAYHEDQYIEGIAAGLDHDGCLLLQTNEKLCRILSGEVQVL